MMTARGGLHSGPAMNRSPCSSPAPRRRHSTAIVLTGVGFLSVLAVAGAFLRYPTTDSAPPGLYLLTYGEPVRGSWAVACLPRTVAELGRRRGYLRPGRCPAASSPVLKRVAALAGDQVLVTETGLVVDGEPLPRTARRSHDSHGRPVPSIPLGLYRVAPGEVWLYSDHSPASWDSRYYGPIPLAGVRSRACRLWPSLDCAI